MTEPTGSSERDDYRRLFLVNPQPLWVYDLETLRFLEVNAAATRRYGYSRDEFLSMTIADLRPPEDVPALVANVAAVTEGGVERSGPWRHRTKAGRLIEVEICSQLISFDGRRAELVLAEDITERPVAMLERERLFTAIEQFPDAVLITDRSGAVEYVNPAWERGSGFSRADVLRRDPRQLDDEGTDHAFFSALHEAVTTGTRWSGRLSSQRKGGARYTEEVSISPVRDEHGAIVSLVAVRRDVTQQLELEARSLQAQKMESIGRLAAGVAHDFYNLLTVINSTSELAVQDAPEGSQLQQDVREILSAGQRGAALTRQLLSFTRQQVVKPVVLEPDEILRGFQKLLSRLMTEAVKLELATGAPGRRIRIDASQLEQIVLNLVVNGRDAIVGPGRVVVETSEVPEAPDDDPPLRPSRPPGACYRLAVTDTGAGMAQEVLDSLFAPFFTTKDLGKGTGLGLSTVLRLVTDAGGGLRVHTRVSAGTTFEVFLPLVTGAERVSPAPASTATQPARGATVLVVEDDEPVRLLALRVLEREGFHAIGAAHGLEALRMLEAGLVTPALVVTDVVMPELGGLELAERLARLAPSLPVLFVSGYAPRPHPALSPETLLTKPYTPAALLEAVRSALRGR